MAKPIPATPVLRGQDAKTVRQEMQRPLSKERRARLAEAVRIAKQFVKAAPTIPTR